MPWNSWIPYFLILVMELRSWKMEFLEYIDAYRRLHCGFLMNCLVGTSVTRLLCSLQSTCQEHCVVWLLLMPSCSQTRSAMQCCVSSHTSQQARNSSVCSKTMHLSCLLPDATDLRSSMWTLLWQALMMHVQFIVYRGCSPAHFHTCWQAWYSNTSMNTLQLRSLLPSAM